jgi:hypothetical protein
VRLRKPNDGPLIFQEQLGELDDQYGNAEGKAMPARPSYMKEKNMNAFCVTCDSWVPGGDDDRDEDGEFVRHDYGNRLRKMECGHTISIDDFGLDELPPVEGREGTW